MNDIMICEIKEKIKKNPKYVHPCNKEFQDDIKKFGFESGYKYICWLEKNGILKNKIPGKYLYVGCENLKEYQDKCAKRKGFKDETDRVRAWRQDNKEHYNEYSRNRRHNIGESLPKEFNEDCSLYFGEYIAENYIMKTFEDTIKAPCGTKGYDWTCKKGYKIQHKARCMEYDPKGSDWCGWKWSINYNDIADYFILSAWDNRDSMNPIYIWIFHKNDMIRKGRSNYTKEKFWERYVFSITNTPEKLKEFERYEVRDKLDKLKKICEENR